MNVIELYIRKYIILYIIFTWKRGDIKIFDIKVSKYRNCIDIDHLKVN